MTQSEKTTRLMLMYLGIIPFAILSYGLCNPSHALIPNIDHKIALSSYSSIIISFLAGCIWKIPNPSLLIVSNILALVAWASLLTSSPMWFVLSACFLLLLLLDYCYATLHTELLLHRTIITAMVVTCLGLVGFLN